MSTHFCSTLAVQLAFRPQKKKFLDSCQLTTRQKRQVLQLLPRYKNVLVGN